MKLLVDLFWVFCKIGLFTFGGGYAMLALIENAVVARKKWLTHEEMMNVMVVAESTPGPIAINCATYTGWKQARLLGAIAATVGMVLPSFVILFAISQFFDNFLEIKWVASAFMGIKCAVGLLILQAGLTMTQKMKQKTPLKRFIVIGSALALLAAEILSVRLSTIVVMLAGGFLSLTVSLMRKEAT